MGVVAYLADADIGMMVIVFGGGDVFNPVAVGVKDACLVVLEGIAVGVVAVGLYGFFIPAAPTVGGIAKFLFGLREEIGVFVLVRKEFENQSVVFVHDVIVGVESLEEDDFAVFVVGVAEVFVEPENTSSGGSKGIDVIEIFD